MLAAVVANCHRGKGQLPCSIDQFDPTAESRRGGRGMPITADNIDILIEAMTGQRPPAAEPPTPDA